MARMFERESSLCFNSVDFEKESFDADAFVSNHGRLMDLDSLLVDLKSYHHKIKLSLIEVINSDYQDFVGLSKTLTNVESIISKVQSPFDDWHHKLSDVKSNLSTLVSKTDEVLSESKALTARKNQLISLKAVYTILNFLELNLFDGQGNKMEVSDVGTLKRLSLEISSLNSKLINCDSKSVSETVTKRVEAISEHFLSLLSRSFSMSIVSADEENFISLLQIYSTIERLDCAYQVYRASFVEPYLREKITPSAVQRDPLENVYQEVLNFFPEKALFLVKALKKSTDGVRFEYEIEAVFAEVVDLLFNNCSQVFIPVNWRQFGKRYKASMWFLGKFEEGFSCEEQLHLFRQNVNYRRFLDKWSLPVYFQLVFQEVVSKIEHATSSKSILRTQTKSSNDSQDEFCLAIPDVMFQSFSLCWSDEAYIPSLCHKFLKLSIQISLRFLQWCKAAQNQLENSVKIANDKSSSNSGSSSLNSSLDKIESDESVVSSYEDLLVCLVSDIETFQTKLRTVYDLKIYRELKQHLNVQSSYVVDPFKDVKTKMQQQLKSLIAELAQTIIKALMVVLKPISETPRLYRKTNRATPETESTYMMNLVSKLRDYFEEQLKSMNKGSKQEVLVSVIKAVNDQIKRSVQDIWESVEKIEQSLKKIRSSKSLKNVQSAANVQDADTASDSDKIYLQLYIDVVSYQCYLASLGQKLEIDILALDSSVALKSQIEFASSIKDRLS